MLFFFVFTFQLFKLLRSVFTNKKKCLLVRKVIKHTSLFTVEACKGNASSGDGGSANLCSMGLTVRLLVG